MAFEVASTPPMVVLRPGDRVLVALADDPEPELIQQIAAGLRQSFPGVDFTIVSGVAGMCIQAGGA